MSYDLYGIVKFRWRIKSLIINQDIKNKLNELIINNINFSGYLFFKKKQNLKINILLNQGTYYTSNMTNHVK